MLYGLSRNLCQNSAKIVWNVQKYTQKYIAAVTSLSVPTNVVWQPWNACQYSQKLQLLSSSISVHITYCMTSTNLYGTTCSSLLSEIHTSLCFGMCALLQQMLSLFSAQPLSFSLLFSQQECCNFLVLGISPRTSWHLTKNLLLSQQDCCFHFFSCSWHLTKSLLASHQDFSNILNLALSISPRASWHLTKISSTPSSLLLASHQEPLGISPRVSCSLNKIASTSLALGISPRASWPLTKISSTYPRMGVPTCLNQPHEGR
jgi:hypothetical protein